MRNHLTSTFSFNPEKFNFWEIYESIAKYYPIGIPKNESKFSQSFQGHKDLVAILLDNIHNEKNFKIRWVSFDKEIKKLSQKKVIGTTYGQVPCFSSYVEIEKKKYKNFTHFKELHYFVSLLGNFYTVIGDDRNEMTERENKFRTTNYLAVSPEHEFAKTFNLLCEQIEMRFTGFRFVPFQICAQTIIGLDVKDDLEKQDTIFDAIFGGSHIRFNNRILGNEFYKADEWIREGYVDTGSHWTIYPTQE
jgi:hypothetical protein